jgi:hypothetical protein
VGAVVGNFHAGLAHERLAKPGVYIGGRSSLQSVGCRCVHGLLAVCAEDIWVVGLGAYSVDGVGRVGVAGGCGAGRVAF